MNPDTLTRYQGCGSGNQTSAIITGGYGPGVINYTDGVRVFDGVCWSSIANDLVATNSANCFGTAEDAVRVGGATSGGVIATAAQFNGCLLYTSPSPRD